MEQRRLANQVQALVLNLSLPDPADLDQIRQIWTGSSQDLKSDMEKYRSGVLQPHDGVTPTDHLISFYCVDQLATTPH